MTESDLYGILIVEATRFGHRLFRNQIGRARYARGGDVFTVPYGVGGVGGSDLIGFTFQPFFTPLTLGSPGVAVFTAIEVKTKSGRIKPEQQRFLDAVRAAGGIAGVCRSIEDYHKLIGHQP